MEFASNTPSTSETAMTTMEVGLRSLELLELVDQSPQKNKTTLLNSTSTVVASDTILNPNFDQFLFCISAILQAQIFDDEGCSEINKNKYPEFNLLTSLPPELGGLYSSAQEMSESVLHHETVNDSRLREKILNGSVPTIDTIFRFINHIFDQSKYSPECNIISLIYVNRLTSASKTPLTMLNWRGIWVGAVLLAQKVWDDQPLKTSSFASILPSVDKKTLKNIEMKAFILVEYVTGVKPSLYAKYYFELRQLFLEIMGTNYEQEWSMKPLSIVKANQLMYRSNRLDVKHGTFKMVGGRRWPPSQSSLPFFNFQSITPKPRPLTLEDVTMTEKSRFVIS
jgi:hypothetical protein